MRDLDLATKWAKLAEIPRQGDYVQLRISPECIAGLFVGMSPDSFRCLLLTLPKEFEIDFKSIHRDKLSLVPVQEKNYVALTLTDDAFHDLFDDLIYSMHSAIWDVAEPGDYSRIFLRTFNRWAQFFEAGTPKRLSRDVLQGLFGEVVYLKNLLSKNAADRVNEILNAWRGPYDRGHDFMLEDVHVEVKTRTTSATGVHVANENQLDQLEGKGLELAIVVVSTGNSESIALSDIVSSVDEMVQERLGDSEIFFRALRQKNLTRENLSDYDDLRFRPLEIESYDCLSAGFPRIVRSELLEPLYGVRYSLNAAKIIEFLIEREAL